MITERTRGRDLLHEVFTDYEESIKKKLKAERDKARKPYVKARKQITEAITVAFNHFSSRYNSWHVESLMVGDCNKPKALNHFHCTTNTGYNGSKKYIILRGMKSAIKAGTTGGYVVSLDGHVLNKMRQRNPEAFGNITDNDKLVQKIFTTTEKGCYYFYDWTNMKKPEEVITDPFELIRQAEREAKEKEREEWLGKKQEPTNNPNVQPIIMRTLAGIFLGFTGQDRSEVTIKSYIMEKDIIDEDLKEIVTGFLTHAWIYYNAELFGPGTLEKEIKYLQEYMKGKEDRDVILLGE